MSDNDGKKTLGVRGGGPRAGNVKQSFSHGRTKNVEVVTKRKRVVVPKPGSGKSGGNPALGDPNKRPKGITDAEMERRLKAVAAAKAREAEDAERRAREEKEREEERQRRREEAEQKEREAREAEEKAKAKAAEEERKRTEEAEAAKRAAAAASAPAAAPAGDDAGRAPKGRVKTATPNAPTATIAAAATRVATMAVVPGN